MCRWRNARRLHQPNYTLPHLAVWTRVDARQKRTGKERQRQPVEQWFGTRLHHAMELRYWRNVDPLGAQHQGRSIRSHVGQRHCARERQPRAELSLSADRTILGRTAWHLGSCIRRGVCADALHIGSFHRERSDEVGFVGSHGAVDSTLVG